MEDAAVCAHTLLSDAAAKAAKAFVLHRISQIIRESGLSGACRKGDEVPARKCLKWLFANLNESPRVAPDLAPFMHACLRLAVLSGSLATVQHMLSSWAPINEVEQLRE